MPLSNDDQIALGRFEGEVLARLDSIDDNLRRAVDDAKSFHSRITELERLATQLKTLTLVVGPILGLVMHRVVNWFQWWPKK